MINEIAIQAAKRRMIYVCSNNVRHPVTMTFTPLHYTSPSYISLFYPNKTDKHGNCTMYSNRSQI